MSAANTSPSSDPARELEALRETNGLEPVTPDQEGVPVGLLPAGLYGFTYSVPGRETPLFDRKTYQSFEIHKRRDGTAHIIGFVTPEDAAALSSGEPCDIRLFPDPESEAQRLVCIPFQRVVRSRMPSRAEGNWMPLQVG